MKSYVICLLLILMIFPMVWLKAEIIYVDNTLNQNITNGSYSIVNRNNTGSDGNAYQTVQGAVNVVSLGDSIYIRGGRYIEHIALPSNRQGTEQQPIVMRSFPGEWAILDGSAPGNATVGYAVLWYGDGGHGYCPKYWEFSNFEVTGGQAAQGGSVAGEKGCGIMFDTAWYITFKYLYIHDNEGNGGYNDAGICIQNEDQAPQHITIKYCYFRDNSCLNSHNCANIVLFGDYAYYNFSANNAKTYNRVAYNYLYGSCCGIADKNSQYLMNEGGNDLTYQDRFDEYDHNIVEQYLRFGIAARQDFVQVHHNIVRSTTSQDEERAGITLGSNGYNGVREPFYACAYNNLMISRDMTLENLEITPVSYNPPFHPHCYIYNNILENVGAMHNNYNRDMTIYRNGSVDWSDVDMGTVHIEKNLFIPRSRSYEVFTLVDPSPGYSINTWITNGWSDVLYNRESLNPSGGVALHKSGSDYKCNGNFDLDGGTTQLISGGIGGPHPYLTGRMLPSYVGAADPEDDDWVSGVLLDLTNVSYLMNAWGDPPWIEGSHGGTNFPPAAPINLRIEN